MMTLPVGPIFQLILSTMGKVQMPSDAPMEMCHLSKASFFGLCGPPLLWRNSGIRSSGCIISSVTR